MSPRGDTGASLDEPASTWLVLVLPILLVLSAGFSAVETAVFRLDEVYLRALVRGPNPPPARAVRILRARGRLLSALLLANTAVNIGFAAVMTSVLLATSRPSVPRYMVQALSTAVSAVLILFWGEIVPKTFATRRPVELAVRFAIPAAALAGLLHPVTYVADAVSSGVIRVLARGAAERTEQPVTPETIEAATDIAFEDGAVPAEDRRAIQRALEFADTRTSEIMTPRRHTVWLPDTSPAAVVLKVILRSGRSIIPLYAAGLDRVTGTVHVQDLLPLIMSRSLDRPAQDIARRPHFVAASRPVSELLREMRRLRLHLAVVLDERGRTSGLVTMDDVARAMAGGATGGFDPRTRPVQLDAAREGAGEDDGSGEEPAQ